MLKLSATLEIGIRRSSNRNSWHSSNMWSLAYKWHDNNGLSLSGFLFRLFADNFMTENDPFSTGTNQQITVPPLLTEANVKIASHFSIE